MAHIFTSITILFTLITAGTVFSQGIHLNNGGKIRIRNNGFVVLNTSSTNGIQTTGTGNAIFSEGENNRIKWKTSVATGTYSIPFRNESGTDIPITIDKTSSGTESSDGFLLISTYPTNPSNISWPSDVTNMNGNTGDMSYYSVDRFWIIDASGYSAKPDMSITVTYDENEMSAPNTINETAIQGQRFNNSVNSWTDINPAGSVNAASNVVSGINFSGNNMYRSITLVDNSVLLPVVLVDFYYKCHESKIQIFWSTSAEINNDKFIIEKSGNKENLSWEVVTELNGAGNSHIEQNYSIWDKHPEQEIYYYRLKQVDFNGRVTICGLMEVKCAHEAAGKIHIYTSPSAIILQYDEDCETEFLITIFDASGRLIWSEPRIFSSDNHSIFLDRRKFSSGFYSIIFENVFLRVSAKFEIL